MPTQRNLCHVDRNRDQVETGTRPRGISDPARILVWRHHHHYHYYHLRGVCMASIVVWPQSGPRRSQGRVAPSLTYPKKTAAHEIPPPARFENPPFRYGMGASPKRVSKTGGRNIVARPGDGPAGSPAQRGR